MKICGRRVLLEVVLTQLMFKCPKTKRLIPTHVDIDLAEIDTLPVAISSSAMLIPSGGRVTP
jgi:hypothetical protein